MIVRSNSPGALLMFLPDVSFFLWFFQFWFVHHYRELWLGSPQEEHRLVHTLKKKKREKNAFAQAYEGNQRNFTLFYFFYCKCSVLKKKKKFKATMPKSKTKLYCLPMPLLFFTNFTLCWFFLSCHCWLSTIMRLVIQLWWFLDEFLNFGTAGSINL